MKFKKLLAVVLSIAMVLSSMSFNVFAEEPDTSGDIINVDALNAQDVLDGKYGSINGKTINFTENITDVLDLARPTKYQGSDTTYYKYDISIPGPETTATEWSEDISSVMNSHSHYYRTLSDVTFTANDGVSIAGFTFSAGHVASTGYDYVRDVELTSGETYYKHSSMDNITFSGLTVTGQFDAKLYLEGCTVENIAFDGCVFTGTTDDESNAAIKFLADNQYFTDVTVKNCSIDGYNQGVYIAGIDGTSVINNNISNTVHNAIALQSCDGDNPAKGTIVVEENYITNVSNRAIRMNYVGDADIAINNNIMVNCGDDDGQLIKAESVAAEATVDLEANYWDGKDITVAVPGFTAPTTVGVTGGTWDIDVSEYVADGYEFNEEGNVVESAPVATVDGEEFTDLQEAIKAAAPNGTVEIIKDVTVDEWVMIAERLTIGNDDLITLVIDGMTINGNGHTLTINSIESAGNGGQLFFDATKLNIKNLTIKYADGLSGGIGLKAGTIENVTFDGCVYAVMPQTGNVEIKNCTFKTKGTSIYFEEERDGLVIDGCTFENPDNVNVVLLRGDVEFTNNTVVSGRTVNVVSGSPVVTGNNFNDVRVKVYNNATATIEYNEINVLEFNSNDEVKSTFDANIYSDAAKQALTAVNVSAVKPIAALNDVVYSDIAAAFEQAEDGAKIVLLGDIYIKEPLTIKTGTNVTLDLNGATLAGLDTATKNFGLINIQSGASLTIEDSSNEKTGRITLKAENDRDWNAYSSVVSNQRGKLTVNGGTIEHLGGTDMAYGIDNLTNGKGTYAETVINGGKVKSTYRAIRQFLNGTEADNILSINGGVVEGTNKAVWMQDANKAANPGALTITDNAVINGDIYLFVTEGSTEWPVDVSIVTSAVNGEILTANIPEGYEIVNNNGEFSVKESVIPEGTVNYCYTSTDRFWGQSEANATESFVIKIYEGDMQIASASLNNINGIINGDVEVSWWIPFSGNADEYWDIAWAEGYPKYDMNPTAVKLFSDGVLVDTNSVKFNAPDDLNKIVALAEDAEGNVKAYTSLKDAIGKFNGRKVNVLRDVSESIDGFYGCTLTTNVEGGVTITDTNTVNWIDFDDVTVGKGVTVDINLPYSGDSENVILGTLVAGETYYHGYDAKTTIKDGGKVIVEGSTILRYNETDDAGLYIYGDGDNSTVEFDCGYYIGAYSGTFYAKDANINAGYFLLKNSYDNDSYADIDMSLDNSSVTIVGTSDTQDSFIIDDKAHLTLTNSSVIDDVRDFNILAGTQLDINIDSTSSIEATNATAADDVEFNVAIDANGKIIFTRELSGSGTEEDPYLINNADELKGFRTNVNNGNNYAGKYVKLNADIDLAYENWTPIGDTLYNTKYAPVDTDKIFSGVFDGNNKVISNLKIEKYLNGGADADANIGFFGYVGEDAVIKNLTITNVDIDTDGRNVGALAGVAYKAAFENITINGDIQITGGNNVCGVCAMTRYYAMTAKNITVSGNDGSSINGNNIVGGIFAEIAPNGSDQTFENLSVENVAINGVGGVGGIVGLLTTGAVSDVSVKNITLVGKTTWKENEDRIRLGSIVGLLGSTNGTVSNVIAVENVTAKNLEGEDVVLPVVGANYDASSNATEARIGDKYYATLALAFNDAQPGETVTLLADVAEEVVIPEGVIFDANGFSYIVTGLKGEGTEENPYLISSKSELEWFRDNVDKQAADGSTQYAGKYIKLTTDIDLAGENWNPIGSMAGDHGSFKGIFDGDNHTISNLNVQTGGNGIGLFARTTGNAVIKNLKLHNVTVKSTDNSNYVGGLVGNSYASTKIENVHVTGDIDISGRGYIGGISGHGYVVMDNVSVVGEGTISSTFWCAGGVLGYAGEGATNIMNAHVEGIKITSAAGGLGAIVGMAEDNNGTQPISGSNLSAKDVEIKTYTGAYGDAYANYALGYLYGGNPTSKLTGNLSIEDVVIETSTGEEAEIVDAAAKIGNTVYFLLQDAIDAAQDNDTIVITSDVYLSAPVKISGKTLTLDLATYTIEDKSAEVLSADDDIWGLIVLENNANLTICGTGTIKCNYTNVTDGWTGMAYGIDVDKTSTLTVNGGNFINGNGGIQARGTVIVNDGTFVSHNGGTCIMALYSDANVTVNGGTFKDSVEAEDIYTGSGAVWSGFGATVTINGGYFDFSADPSNENVVWTLFPAQNAIAGLGNSNNANMTVVGGTFVNFNPETDVIVDYSPSAGFTFGSVVEEGYECEQKADGSFGIIRAELKGDGSEEKPFLINNKADLEWFRNAVNSGNSYTGKVVKLATDIDLENEAWTPIGTKDYPFMGTFDGADNTISNLKVEGEANQGFFGYVTKAKINNLKLNNVNVKGTDCVAAVVGQGYAETYIDNCAVTGSIKIEGLTNVGGITGKYYARVTDSVVDGTNTTSSYIKGVYKKADLEGDNVGGIMGHAGENNAHSNNTVKNITIEGTRKVGGLIGTTDRATDLSGCVVENVIIKCTATEEYAADNAATTTIGGLIGNYYGNSTGGTILSSTVEKVVFEKGNAKNVGAIVGGVRVAPEATTVEGVTVDDNIVVEGVTGTTNGLLVPAGTYEASADGIRYATIADAMAQATAGSTVVIYAGDYQSGLNVNKSITVVGDGEVNFKGKLNVTADGAKVKGLNFNNGGSSAGYIGAKDVVIENCEVVGGNGFRSCYTSGTVTFKDSTITGSTYGIHFDGSKGGNIVIDNCTITGWTSFASTITKVTITNSRFADGNYDKLRFYQDAEITDTTFNENMSVDFGKNEVNCTIKDCTVEGNKSLTDVIYLADIAEMGVNVTIDDEPVKVPASLTKDNDTVYYLSIQEALDAANGAGTITLTEDTAENITVKAPISTFALNKSADLVLDLNGKTLTGYVTVEEGATIEIKNGTIINKTTNQNTISSFGNIILTDVNADGVRHIVRAKKGTVVINGGTYKYTGSENGTRHAVNIGDDADPTNNVATAEIYGGTFIGPKGTAADSGSAVLVQTGSTVTVFGGEFSGGKLHTLSAQENAVLDLRGGTYDQNPAQYVIQSAFAACKNADGTYSVVADRKLVIKATPCTVKAGEPVTVEIIIDGDNIAGTSWTLNWNPSHFKPLDADINNTGSVNDSAWTTGQTEVYADGDIVKTYTFEALPQDANNVESIFTLSNPCASTHIESFDGTEIAAGVSDGAKVIIVHKDYDYSKLFDGTATNEDSASVDFDGNAHTFKIVPADSSLVNAISYKVDGVEVTEVALTEEGTYTISYKIDGKAGYADYEGTFTITVDKANYVVEVSDYTFNTKLVLVYTNTSKLRFKYDNAAMIDVKEDRDNDGTDYAKYKYNNTDEYSYVYGYVVYGAADEAMITYTGDAAEVFVIDNTLKLADINFSNSLNVQDITTEYGVMNEHPALFANVKYQKQLLKADTNGDKKVGPQDTSYVVSEVKTAMGLRK